MTDEQMLEWELEKLCLGCCSVTPRPMAMGGEDVLIVIAYEKDIYTNASQALARLDGFEPLPDGESEQAWFDELVARVAGSGGRPVTARPVMRDV